MKFHKVRFVALLVMVVCLGLPSVSSSDSCADWYNGVYGGVDGSYSGVHIRVGYGNYDVTAWYSSPPSEQTGFCTVAYAQGGCGLYDYTYGYTTHYSFAGGTSDNEAVLIDGPWAY